MKPQTDNGDRLPSRETEWGFCSEEERVLEKHVLGSNPLLLFMSCVTMGQFLNLPELQPPSRHSRGGTCALSCSEHESLLLFIEHLLHAWHYAQCLN